MPITTTATAGAANSGGALTEYLRSFAEPSRYKNYEMRPWGTSAIQPGYQGLNIYAPTFTNDTTSGVLSLRGADKVGATEGTAPSSRALAFGSYSGTLGYYADTFQVSKVFAATATLRDYLERAAQFLMVGCAKTEEEIIQDELFWSTWSTVLYKPGDATNGFMWVEPDGTEGTTATWGTVNATPSAAIVPEAFAQARKLLRNKNNPGFSEANGKFIAFVSPNHSYNLITNVTAGTNLRFEQDSMNMTAAYQDNVIGDLFGCRLIETTSNPTFGAITVANGNPHTGDLAGEYAMVVAPDAYYVASHETLNPQLYYEGFETGGVSNPTHSYATLSTDYMFECFSGDADNKMVVIPTTT